MIITHWISIACKIPIEKGLILSNQENLRRGVYFSWFEMHVKGEGLCFKSHRSSH